MSNIYDNLNRSLYKIRPVQPVSSTIDPEQIGSGTLLSVLEQGVGTLKVLDEGVVWYDGHIKRCVMSIGKDIIYFKLLDNEGSEAQTFYMWTDSTASFDFGPGSVITVDDLIALTKSAYATFGVTGRKVTFSTTGTLPSPLLVGTTYYTKGNNAYGIRLYLTYADSVTDSNRVNLTTQGSGNHTVVKVANNSSFYSAVSGDLGTSDSRWLTAFVNSLSLSASTTTRIPINIPQGVTPTSPAEGDMWYDDDGDLKFENGDGTQILKSYFPISIFLGDGSDGDVGFDGTATYSFASKSGSVYTLTADVFASIFSVDLGITINTAGFKIFCTGIFTNAGTIQCNGGDGGDGPDAIGSDYFSGGVGGTAAQVGGTLPDSLPGPDGGHGGAGAQPAPGSSADGNPGIGALTGTSIIHSLGTAQPLQENRNAGQGGTAGVQAGGIGGLTAANGTATTIVNKLWYPYHIAKFRDVDEDETFTLINGSAGQGGAPGGGGGAGGVKAGGETGGGGGGGSGGGGGAAGGTILILAYQIINTGTIQANGGAGGNGGSGGDGWVSSGAAGQGGGGAGLAGLGGNGGIIYMVYIKSYNNSGTVQTLGGSGGTTNGVWGVGINGGGDGWATSNPNTLGLSGIGGVSGVVYTKQLI